MVALMNEGGFDLVTASGDASLRLISGGRVQEVNTALIPSWNTVDPRLQSAPWHTVGDKHYGDASGSDIYNLGVTCSIVGAADCQTKGCPTGQHCDVCRTLSGPAYVCLPDGATC